jgi:hypothetical protein
MHPVILESFVKKNSGGSNLWSTFLYLL